MPGGGFDVFAEIRQREDGGQRKTPVMAVTAYSRQEDQRRIVDAGFQRYVPKPVTPSALVKEVAELARNG